MFKQLSNSLSSAFQKLTGKSEISETNISEAIKAVEDALLQADVALPVVTEFISKIRQQAIGAKVATQLKPDQLFKKIVHDSLLELLTQDDEQALKLTNKPPTVILLCGLQGAGKTTTCAKLAHLIKTTTNKQHIMLTSTDTARPGAIEQLSILAQQSKVEFYSAEANDSPINIAKNALKQAQKSHIDVLIIDTAGRLHIDEELMTEIKLIHEATTPDETLFIMDSSTGQDAAHSAEQFKRIIPLTGTIITKVDGDSRGGAALSAKMITKTPIKFVGNSEKITSGLEAFDPKRFTEQILDMGDIVGLVTSIEKNIDQDQAKSLAKRMKRGQFDFNDFANHIKQMQKMGGINNLINKMPGAQQYADQIAAANPEKGLNQSLAIINSMTKKERCNPDLISGRRKTRIAKGSGQDLPTINKTLKQFKQMQKVIKKSKGKNLQSMLAKLGLGNAGIN